MISFRFPLLTLVVVGLGIGLSSCDSDSTVLPPTDIAFNGVTYAAVGQADLELTSDGLVVSNIGSSGNDGVRVAPTSAIGMADIQTLPIDLPSGGRWGMEVFGETGSGSTGMATVWNEAVDGGEESIQFDFAPELNVSALILEYFLEGRLQHSATVPANGAGNFSARLTTAGTGAGRRTSVHVICVGGELIVATDNNGDAPRTLPGGCGAELLTDVPGADGAICADYVQARPVTELSFPEVTSLQVTARTIPQFTITDGSVEGHQ